MSKVFLVEKMFHDFQIEDLINGPFTDGCIVKVFSTREEAEDWVNNNFTRFLNADPGFVDFKINEKEVDEYVYVPEEDVKEDVYLWASVDKDNDVRLYSFTSTPSKEYIRYDSMDKRFYINARVPRRINSKKSLVDFLKKKAEEVKNK